MSSETSLNSDEPSEYESDINKNIFDVSKISTRNFNLLLTLFTSRFNLSFKCPDERLKLMEFCLPQQNNLSTNFNNMIKSIEFSIIIKLNSII